MFKYTVMPLLFAAIIYIHHKSNHATAADFRAALANPQPSHGKFKF